jgi:hypothetical protein
MRFVTTLVVVIFAVLCAIGSGAASASVVTPVSDDEIIEVLPALSGTRAERMSLRRALTANPQDAESAVQLSRLYLDQAHTQGDPRFAGQALAIFSPWPDMAIAPDDVVLMVATIQQYFHDFDTAALNLEQLVRRRPGKAQAWLTLATVRRVQGRYQASDAACESVAAAGADLYARACTAENDSLRGDYAGTRRALNSLLTDRRVTVQTRNWLLTTLAESEARAGLTAASESAYRAALDAEPDTYTTLSFSDFLIDQERYSDALLILEGQPRTDAVLLRVAIAGVQAKLPKSRDDVHELRERMDLANLRPEARSTHAREQAMFALWIDSKPHQALELARENVRHQREPLDLLIFAQAVAANNDTNAKRELDSLVSEIGLQDVRLNALR